MKITIALKDIKDFKKVFKVQNIKVIAGAYGIELYGTNRRTEFFKKVEGVIESKGTVVIDSDLLNLLGNSEIIITENSITDGITLISIKNVLEVEDHKPINIKRVISEEIKSKDFKEILEIEYATAEDETRPVLKNIFMNGNEACAIDGYRLARRITNLNLEKQILIPTELVKILKKIKGDVKILEEGNQTLILEIGDYKIRFTNQDMEFINYKSLIPMDNKRFLKIDSKEMLQMIKRAIKLKERVLNFKISTEDIRFKIERFDIIFEQRIKVESNFEMIIAVDIRFLKDYFSLITGEVIMEFSSSVSPIILKNENKIDMILPIRVCEN